MPAREQWWGPEEVKLRIENPPEGKELMSRVVTFDNKNPLRELIVFAPGIDGVRSKLDGKRSTLTTVAKSTKSAEEGGEDENDWKTGQQQKKQKKVKKTTGKKPTKATSKKRKKADKQKTAQQHEPKKLTIKELMDKHRKDPDKIPSRQLLAIDYPEGVATFKGKAWDHNPTVPAEIRDVVDSETGRIKRELIVDVEYYNHLRCSRCWKKGEWNGVGVHDCRDKNKFEVHICEVVNIVPLRPPLPTGGEEVARKKKKGTIRCSVFNPPTTRSRRKKAGED